MYEGPFIVFAEEAHEDSGELLFMPDATAADWATVFSHAEVRQVGEGLALVQAGEQDRALYLLTEGTVGVRLPRDEGAFKTIDAPSVLGELAFFDGRPRSATLDALTDVEVVRLDSAAFESLQRARSRPRARDAARPRPDPRAAPADRQRSDRGPARRLTVRPVVAAVREWLDGGGSRGGDVHAQDAVGGRCARGRVGRPVRGGRGDPAGVHEDRVAGRLHRAGFRPALLRYRHGAGREPRRHADRRLGRVPARARHRPRRPVPGDRHLPRLGRREAQPPRRRRAARADPRLRRVHDDRPRLGPVLRPAAVARAHGLRERLHPAHAQRVRGARRAVPARPARRRRRDRPAEDRRDRRLLRRWHVDRARRAAQPRAAPERDAGALDEPARQADEHRRHRAAVHVERPRRRR